MDKTTMRWQVTIEDKRGIKTVYREFCDSRDLAIGRAVLRYVENHPEMRAEDDWWIHRVEDVDAPDIEGAPA